MTKSLYMPYSQKSLVPQNNSLIVCCELQ
ncbi:hypothetical protein F383_14746 [Gossypium arboreum]|uniref:Uncharacterized protein n=1 Tax=Gossypium arboreum TaxID=29729 RepID=A0A0B0PWV3_GOSAR|nr:hypothetical protein F383_14746 [Gossypium arboreum]